MVNHDDGQIELRLSARKLPNLDVLSKTDAFIVVLISSPTRYVIPIMKGDVEDC